MQGFEQNAEQINSSLISLLSQSSLSHGNTNASESASSMSQQFEVWNTSSSSQYLKKCQESSSGSLNSGQQALSIQKNTQLKNLHNNVQEWFKMDREEEDDFKHHFKLYQKVRKFSDDIVQKKQIEYNTAQQVMKDKSRRKRQISAKLYLINYFKNQKSRYGKINKQIRNRLSSKNILFDRNDQFINHSASPISILEFTKHLWTTLIIIDLTNSFQLVNLKYNHPNQQFQYFCSFAPNFPHLSWLTIKLNHISYLNPKLFGLFKQLQYINILQQKEDKKSASGYPNFLTQEAEQKLEEFKFKNKHFEIIYQRQILV